MSTDATDADVTANITTALRRDNALRGLDISVVTLGGDVRLSGVLDSQAQIDRALEVARVADGMHTIRADLRLRR